MKSLLVLSLGFFVLLASSCSQSPTQRSAELAANQGVLRALNQERRARGLTPLKADSKLRGLAEQHARQLVARINPVKTRPTHASAHQGFQARSKQAEAMGYPILSEVVMIGYAGDLNAVPQRTLKGWLNSSAHRGAILHPDRRVIGVETRLPSDGRYFVVGLLSNGATR